MPFPNELDNTIRSLTDLFRRLSRQVWICLMRWCSMFEYIPSWPSFANVFCGLPLVLSIVPFATVIEHLNIWHPHHLTLLLCPKHTFQRLCTSRARTSKNKTDFREAQHCLIGVAYQAIAKLYRLVNPFIQERQIRAPGVLSRLGPFSYTVADDNKTRHAFSLSHDLTREQLNETLIGARCESYCTRA